MDDASLDLRGAVWTLAGSCRVASDMDATLGVLTGARLLDVKETLGRQFSGVLAPVTGR
jgi:hypothetical protein